jgi:hypothetical protein
MLKLENIIKGVVSTIFGSILMIFAFYGWYFEKPEDQLSDLSASVLGVIGFILVFIRIKLEESLSKILADLPSVIWDFIKKKLFGAKE